jgi:curved DNA-binding protein
MKYKDYYAILGVDRTASEDDIKKGVPQARAQIPSRRLKEKNAEEQFKEVAEAYQTLSDKEKRAAYDQLGRHRPGEDFRPPPGWETQFSQGGVDGVDLGGIDLGDLFEMFGHRTHGRPGHSGFGGRGAGHSAPGQDFEASAQLSLEDAARGTELNLELSTTEITPEGRMQRTPRTVRVRVPKAQPMDKDCGCPAKADLDSTAGRPGTFISISSFSLTRYSGYQGMICIWTFRSPRGRPCREPVWRCPRWKAGSP